jgi:hypothetical protein
VVNVQEEQSALPHLIKPHDALRLGIRNLKDQASVAHPVEAIQKNVSLDTQTRTFGDFLGCLMFSSIIVCVTKLATYQTCCSMLQYPQNQEELKMNMLKNLYGSALPARMQLDKQILSKCVSASSLEASVSCDLSAQKCLATVTFNAIPGFTCVSVRPGQFYPPSASLLPFASFYRVNRLPGFPSSHLGLQSMSGELDEFGVESYLGSPEEAEIPGPDMHSVMEGKLNMKTPPVKRAII